MKTLFIFVLVLSCSVAYSQNQQGEVLVDNEKMKVVKHEGKPDNNVCGEGMHHHEAHLTVALSNAEVLITQPDGTEQMAEIPKEAAIWFEAGTHSAINTGEEPTKFLLIYLKE